MPRRIVILGAGFAGIQAAVDLSKTLGAHGEAEITLVSDQNFFLFTPLLPQIASSNIDPRHIAQPVRDLRGRHHFRFVRASVRDLDLDRREVHLDIYGDLEKGADTLAFDYLVISPGSRADYFGIPGARENTWDFKSLDVKTSMVRIGQIPRGIFAKSLILFWR